MNFITLTKDNIEQEHICCAISNNNDCQVAAKKGWLGDRFEDGLVFLKGDVRGKCFIEYIPAENAWAPIDAPGYMYINCLWVSGQFKGIGAGGELLERCIIDSREKGKKGLAVLSSKKKKPFLADSDFLKYKGFTVADSAQPFFELYYLPFVSDTEAPRFKSQAKEPHVDENGFMLYYTHQCPYTAKYVPLIEQIATARGVKFKAVHMKTAKQAQDAPSPFTSYSLFYNGKFITHEILSEKKFEKLIDEM